LLIAILGLGAGDELWMRFVPNYLLAVGATVWLSVSTMREHVVGAIYAYPRKAELILGGIGVHSLSPFVCRFLFGLCDYSRMGGSDGRNVTFSFPGSLLKGAADFSHFTRGAHTEATRHPWAVGVQMVIKHCPMMRNLRGILIDRFGIINGVAAAFSPHFLLRGHDSLCSANRRRTHTEDTKAPRHWTEIGALESLASCEDQLSDSAHVLSDILIRLRTDSLSLGVIFAMDTLE